MDQLAQLLDFFLHLDRHLQHLIEAYGLWTYLILAAIVFCETGLVITPFLPGDSLLFAAGAFCATGALQLEIVIPLLAAAAILGDAANYAVGYFFGPTLVHAHRVRFIRQQHLDRTHQFFEKYGGKTIVMARFVPIVRTLAPFVAGFGSMSYLRFSAYNVTGGILWVVLCTLGGYFFGNLPFVRDNFSLVILAIIVISILPGVFEWWRLRRQRSA